MSAPVIETRGLSKSFGAHKVLDGVNLSVARGESLVVIGGSGTGKSVLLRTILGLESADAGEVLLDGQAASPAVRARFMRDFGMLFQNAALFEVFDQPGDLRILVRDGGEIRIHLPVVELFGKIVRPVRIEQVDPGEEGSLVVHPQPAHGVFDHFAGAATQWRPSGTRRWRTGAVDVEPLLHAAP